MRIFEEEAKFYEKTGEKYNIQKSKLKSARGVIYNEFNIYFSYALETGLMAKYNKLSINNNFILTLEPSTISEYYQIGTDYVSSFIKWDVKSKFYAVLKKIRDEEESKKNKEKEKDKDKENNGANNTKESRRENKNKKVLRLTKINNGKNYKDIYKNNNKTMKKEKINNKTLIKEIKDITAIVNNSMVILPKLIDGDLKQESHLSTEENKKDNLQNNK